MKRLSVLLGTAPAFSKAVLKGERESEAPRSEASLIHGTKRVTWEVAFRAFSLGSCLVLASPSGAVAADEPIDVVSRLAADKTLYWELGLAKLTPWERAAWNRILAQTLEAGTHLGPESRAAESAPNGSAHFARAPAIPPSPGGEVRALRTKVVSDDGEILTLENGAIVEITSGYLGYVGYRKDALLFRRGTATRIWIEGKKDFACDILKAPAYGTAISGVLTSIVEVKGNGAILVMADGSILEVDQLDLLETGLWLEGSDAMVLETGQLINLDSGGALIDVRPLR
jgi:hypothetical protein